MKLLLRSFLFNTMAIYFASIFIPGFKISGGAQFYFISGFILTLLNFFIKPVAKLLFFPINLVTLGIFSWLINAGIIWALTKVVKEIEISSWTFPGFNFSGFSIPELWINNLSTIILVSFFIAFFIHFLNWLKK